MIGQKISYIKYKREPITEGEKNKIAKKKNKEVEHINIVKKKILGIYKHLSFLDNIKSLTINSYDFNKNLIKIH